MDPNIFIQRVTTDERSESNARALLAYLKDAMEPFRPVDPWMEVTHNIDYQTYTLFVEMKNLPWFKFKHRFSRDAILSLYDPDVIFVEAGLAIRDYWNSFEWREPEDNIILGDS